MPQVLGAGAHEKAMSIALSGIADGIDLGEIARELEALHPKNDTFPGEVLLELAADAIEEPSLCGITRDTASASPASPSASSRRLD